MVSYKVSVSDEAKEALQEIHYWLKENESTTIADRVRDGILDEIDSLAKMPQKHGIAQEIQNDQILYRRILKWAYRIIFTIDEDEIEVLVVDIVHTKQDPKRLQDKFGN
jgi:plasmid stabilization system protein ParE